VGWKDGATAYARLIKHYTTMNASPEQVHQTGLREVDRIEQEMQGIARDYGFTGSLSAFERELAGRPGMHFESQDEMLAYASDVLAALQPTMSKLFLHVPRAVVGIRPIPADREASQASNYVAGTADGSRQAWFNMNTYRPRDQVKYTVEALVLHETIPGHHLQVGLARELDGVPQFQRAFSASAFAEGWGLYAESLGTSLGVVYRDPPTRFGRLESERFRAVRLVVDTGLHAMGWSRDRAREYFAAHAPSQSLAEVDRYIARPGQALGYKLGQLKIVELRDRAQKALGPRFDLRAFHDVVLRSGTIPLDLLEEQVDAYIAEARRRE
jgi:prolyl oligopeptidase